ncbi:hypothetical protein D3C73_1230890 [compost metagenome]
MHAVCEQLRLRLLEHDGAFRRLPVIRSEYNPARRRGGQPGQQPQQGGFAAPGHPAEDRQRALANLQVNVLKSGC